MPSTTAALQDTSVPATDLSIQLLNQIFGDNWTTVTTIANTDSLLFELLNDFNKVVLSIVVLSFLWTMAIASANTANEGKPLGEKFSTMWVPIRAMMGVSFLVPVFGGLSMFQVTLLQGVYYSIDVANGANTLVHTRLFNDMPSGVIKMEEIPGLKEHAKDIGSTVLRALVLQEYYIQKEGVQLKDNAPPFTVSDDTTYALGMPQKVLRFTVPDVSSSWSKFWASANMPKIKIPCEMDAGGDETCTKRVKAVKEYAESLKPVAFSIVNRSMPRPKDTALNNEDQIKAFLQACSQYITESKKIALDAMKGPVGDGLKKKMDEFYNSGSQKTGWLALGAYYWVASNAMSETMQIAVDLPVPDEANLKDISAWCFSNGSLDDMYDKVERLIEQTNTSANIIKSIDKTSGFLGASGISDATTAQLITWMAGSKGGNDVITSMQNIGHWIILGCNTLVTTVGIAALTSDKDGGGGAVGWIAGKAAGFAGPMGKAAGGLIKAAKKLGKLSLVALLVLYPLGFTLAFLLPAIPLIIWTMAVINWAISVLSLIIGSTVWAAAISLPEGEGMAGNHGREGFMLLANCLLRPFLMVFGFVISFLLIRFLGGFLQEIFMVSSTAMNSQYSRGLVTVIATVGIFGMIVMVSAQKIYGLIVHFPDMILSYVGKHLGGSGEGQDHQKIEAMFKQLGASGSKTLSPGG